MEYLYAHTGRLKNEKRKSDYPIVKNIYGQVTVKLTNGKAKEYAKSLNVLAKTFSFKDPSRGDREEIIHALVPMFHAKDDNTLCVGLRVPFK